MTQRTGLLDNAKRYSAIHSRRLAFNHPDGPQASDFASKPCAMNDVDDQIDIFVGGRLLLGEPLPTLRAGNDPLALEFLIDATSLSKLAGGGAAKQPARAVTAGAKGMFHTAGLANEHPARAPHIAGNNDRLTDVAILRRQLGMTRGKAARGAFAMNPDWSGAAVDLVLFELGDVMRDVVYESHLQFLPSSTEDLGKAFASLPHE